MQQQVFNSRGPWTLWAGVGILVLSSVLGWGAIGYSGGPVFSAAVETRGSIPKFVLTDTDPQDADTVWSIEADSQLNGDLSIRRTGNQPNPFYVIPFMIEKEAPHSALVIDSTGRVGLGTSAPRRSLHIEDNFSTTGISFEDTARNQEWDLSVGGAGFRVIDVTGATIPFHISPGARGGALWINSDGDVGMSTDPIEAVDVARVGKASRFQLTSFSDTDSDAAQFIQRRARGSRTTPGAVQTGDNLGLFSFRGMRPNGNFSGSRATITAQATEPWTNDAQGTRLVFGTTPNGTSTVQSVLEITHDGRVLINGSQLDVPDYVFGDDYELMPLDDLQAYITEHQHLPEVASEAEVKAGGVDLASTQMALLKKIEELTLYTLEQHEQLRILQRKLAALEQPE